MSSDESPLYSLTVVGCNCVLILYIMRYECLHYKKAKGSCIPYFIPIIVALLYLIEDAFSYTPLGPDSMKNLKFFVAFCSGSIFSGTFCCRYNRLPLIFKNFELLMLICAIAMIAAIPTLLSSSNSIVRIGGGNHQAISYSAALAFGGIYCSLSQNLSIPRYRIFKLKVYPTIAVIMLVLLAAVCFIGGGRGGAVLLITNFLVCTYVIAKEHFIKIFLILFLVIGIVYLLSGILPGNFEVLIDRGLERSFAFIDSDGNIDLQNGSSGRDNVYSKAIDLIDQRPTFGYGIFSQYELCKGYIGQPYAHNVFLEIALQWGLVGLTIFAIILFAFMTRIYQLIKSGPGFVYLLPIVTFPLVMLQFSGTYLFNASFWFVFIIAFGYKKWLHHKNIRKMQ